MNANRLLNVMKMRALQIRVKQKRKTTGKRLKQMTMLKTYATRLTGKAKPITVR